MKSLFFLALIFSFLSLQTFSYSLKSSSVQFAINCGSSQAVTGSDGIHYQADRGCDTGRTADYSQSRELASATVRYTEDQIIYMTERHDVDSFTYKIPLQESGSFVLILKFAEMYFKDANKRQFNIKFGSSIVVKSLDIFKSADGPVTAYDEYIQFEYDELTRLLKFQNQPIASAVDFGGNLLVTFEKISGKDNPMVQGIVLFHGKLEETDYSMLETYKKLWDRRLKEKIQRKEQERQRKEEASMKRKEKVKIRNNAFDSEDLDTENIDDDDVFVKQKTITDYVCSPLGFIAITVILALFLYLKNSFKEQQKDLHLSKVLPTDPQPKNQEKQKQVKKKQK